MTGQAETVILGIDPGLRHTGWGIIRAEGNQLAFIACGTVSTVADAELAQRLAQLHEGLVEVLGNHSPTEAAVESTFVNRDPNATLKLGQARGVALLVPALAGMPVAEYAPNAIKKTVTGTGHGDKRQIMMMVQRLLPRAVVKGEHAADALAVAICHAHMRQSRQLHAQIAASGKG